MSRHSHKSKISVDSNEIDENESKNLMLSGDQIHPDTENVLMVSGPQALAYRLVIQAEDLRRSGKPKEAYVENRKILDYLSSIQGMCELKVTALSNLGLSCEDLGKYKEAVDYYLEAKKIAEENKNEIHPQVVATVLDNLGGVYHLSKDLTSALKYHEEALKLREEIYKDHPNDLQLAYSLNNLGSLYLDLKRPEEGLKFLQRALRIRKDACSKYADRTLALSLAKSFNNVGTAYHDLRKLEQAIENHQQARIIRKKVYEGAHPEVAHSCYQLSSIYLESCLDDDRIEINKYEYAKIYIEEALHIIENYKKEEEALYQAIFRNYYLTKNFPKMMMEKEFSYVEKVVASTEIKVGKPPHLMHIPDDELLYDVVQRFAHGHPDGLCKEISQLNKAIKAYEIVTKLIQPKNVGKMAFAMNYQQLARFYCLRYILNDDSKDYEESIQLIKKAIDFTPTTSNYCEYAQFIYLRALKEKTFRFELLKQAIIQINNTLSLKLELDINELCYTEFEMGIVPIIIQKWIDLDGRATVNSILLAHYLLVCCWVGLKDELQAKTALRLLEKNVKRLISPLAYDLLADAYVKFSLIKERDVWGVSDFLVTIQIATEILSEEVMFILLQYLGLIGESNLKYDLVLMSIKDEKEVEKILREGNKKFQRKPILFKKDNQFSIYGLSKEEEWRLVKGLDADKFIELKFTDELMMLKSHDVPEKVYDEVALRKGHTQNFSLKGYHYQAKILDDFIIKYPKKGNWAYICFLIDLSDCYLARKEYAEAARLINGAIALCDEKETPLSRQEVQNFFTEFKNIFELDVKMSSDKRKKIKTTKTQTLLEDLLQKRHYIENQFLEEHLKVNDSYLMWDPAYDANVDHKQVLGQLRQQVDEQLAYVKNKSWQLIRPLEVFIVWRKGIKYWQKFPFPRFNEKEKKVWIIQWLYKFIAYRINILLAEMVKECIRIIKKKPPCDYALLSTGSLSREEMTPYSDLELLILIEDKEEEKVNNENRVYFKELSQLLQFKILNLGETGLDKGQYFLPLIKNQFSVVEEVFSPTRMGFSLDIHKNPASDDELINTPKKIAEYQLPAKFIHVSGNHFSVALLNVSYITGKNGKNLVDEYKKLIDSYYNRIEDQAENFEQRVTLREIRAKMFLADDVKIFEPKLSPTTEGALINIKHDLYRLLNVVMNSMAVYYNLSSCSTWDRIDELHCRGIFTWKAIQHLKWVFSYVTALRLKVYSYYRSQIEDIQLVKFIDQDVLKKDKYSLKYGFSSKEVADIQEIYKVLIPLHKAACLLVQKENKDPFYNNDLYDETPFTQGLIALRLCSYEEATICFQKALNSQSQLEDFETIIYYGTALLKQGQLRQTIFYFKEALRQYDDLSHQQYWVASSILNQMGNIYIQLHEFEQALRHYQLALFVLPRAVRKKPLPIIAVLFNGMAEVYRNLKATENAFKCVTTAFDMIELKYGKDHFEMIPYLINLSLVYLDFRHYQEALHYSQKALIIAKPVYGGSHPIVGDILNNMSTVYHQLQRYDESLSYLRQSLESYDVPPFNFFKIGSLLDSMAIVYFEQKEYENALNCILCAELLVAFISEDYNLKQKILKDKVLILQIYESQFKGQDHYSQPKIPAYPETLKEKGWTESSFRSGKLTPTQIVSALEKMIASGQLNQEIVLDTAKKFLKWAEFHPSPFNLEMVKIFIQKYETKLLPSSPLGKQHEVKTMKLDTSMIKQQAQYDNGNLKKTSNFISLSMLFALLPHSLFFELLDTLWKWEDNSTKKTSSTSHLKIEKDDKEIKNSMARLEKCARFWGFECDKLGNDDNCFFRAVWDQLQGTYLITPEDNEQSLKWAVIHYILQHISEFQGTEIDSIHTFISRLREEGEWVVQQMIQALAYCKHLTVVLIRDDLSLTIFRHKQSRMTVYLGCQMGRYFGSLRRFSLRDNLRALDALISVTPIDHWNTYPQMTPQCIIAWCYWQQAKVFIKLPYLVALIVSYAEEKLEGKVYSLEYHQQVIRYGKQFFPIPNLKNQKNRFVLDKHSIQLKSRSSLSVKNESKQQLNSNILFSQLVDEKNNELLSAYSRIVYRSVRKNNSLELSTLLVKIKNNSLKKALVNGVYKDIGEKESPLVIASEMAVHSEGEPRNKALAMMKFLLKQGATPHHSVKVMMAQMEPVFIDEELRILLDEPPTLSIDVCPL